MYLSLGAGVCIFLYDRKDWILFIGFAASEFQLDTKILVILLKMIEAALCGTVFLLGFAKMSTQLPLR